MTDETSSATPENPNPEPVTEESSSPLEGELMPEASAEAAPEEAETAAPEETEAQNESETPLDLPTALRRLEAMQRERDKFQEEALRQQAEQDNLRKRMQREVEKAHKYGLEKFLDEMLPILDSMEMGIEAASKEDAEVATLREGNELIQKMFTAALEKYGIQALDPQGEKFDPNFHEAMSMIPKPEAEDNTVLFVHQKGYLLNERLLRPARVVVVKNS